MNRGLLVLAVLACTACSTLPPNIHREPSFALGQPAATTLGAAFLPLAEGYGGKSGFVPVVAGTNAFLLRAAMAGAAERTLDLQYYIWDDDLTGRAMLHAVMRAAERGVRVRLLLDDIHTEGDTVIFTLVDAHPLVEVRLFNPFMQREVRVAGWLLDGARLNHRMHNKVFIADNALAITGGRNIGDHYFAVDEVSNFRDLDLLAAGPVVHDLSAMFDLYWNSEWSYPVAIIEPNDYTSADAIDLAVRLDDASRGQLPFPVDAGAQAMLGRLLSYRQQFEWGAARVIFDSPDKPDGDATGVRRVTEVLLDTVDGVERELLIETAYFIPGESGVALLESLVDRGVRVAVLTNSQATNDVLAAHAGYMDYRKDLLRAGIALHELRPDALAQRQRMTLLASGSQAALHTKALVYDRRMVFVGSFNLDPRSLIINTEMGVLVESEALAGQVTDMILEGLAAANSYALSLCEGDIRWQVIDDGTAKVLDQEPHTSWWDRFLASLISLLPINDQL